MNNLVLSIGVAVLLCGWTAIEPAIGDDDRMPAFDGAVDWLNSAPLSSKSLRGKVVLVNFWTYSCINSLRELPYVKAWDAKYKDAGLVVIGVHSPEFGFEKYRANVKKAVSDLKISFPVPIDSNHSIWQAFRNEYWPADYIIDAKGRIRYRHFGEGDYEKSERVIQALLKENGAHRSRREHGSHIRRREPRRRPSADVRSPETYVGYARAENFVSPERTARDAKRTYSPPGEARSESVGARRTMDCPCRERHTRLSARQDRVPVPQPRPSYGAGPGKKRDPVRFRIRLNGAAPGEDCGSDSGPDGSGEIRQPRMYQLVRQKGPIKDTVFEIEFLDPGAEAFRSRLVRDTNIKKLRR